MQPQTLASLRNAFLFIMPAVAAGNVISDRWLGGSVRWRRLEDKYEDVGVQVTIPYVNLTDRTAA